MEWKGVWESTRSYVRGDIATWDGSAWHCQTNHTGLKPGTAPGAWKLMVKRASDAKSAS